MPENVRKMSDEEPMSDGGSASPVSRASTNPSPSAELEAVSPKHPLQSDWTLWYFKNDKSKSWDANLKSVSVCIIAQGPSLNSIDFGSSSINFWYTKLA